MGLGSRRQTVKYPSEHAYLQWQFRGSRLGVEKIRKGERFRQVEHDQNGYRCVLTGAGPGGLVAKQYNLFRPILPTLSILIRSGVALMLAARAWALAHSKISL